MSRAWRVYYEKIGEQWLLDRLGKGQPGFWDFHKKRLAAIGMTIERKRLAIGATTAAARAASMPGEAIKRFVQGRRPREQP